MTLLEAINKVKKDSKIEPFCEVQLYLKGKPEMKYYFGLKKNLDFIDHGCSTKLYKEHVMSDKWEVVYPCITCGRK